LEITGNNATVILEGGVVRLGRYEPALLQYLRESDEAWGRPKVEWSEVPVDKDVPRGHSTAIRAFAQAVLTDSEPPVPFEEGIKSLELMNAFVLSHFTGEPVSLPVDRAAYDALLTELRQGTKRLR
jgi:predicted dehydrogenase